MAHSKPRTMVKAALAAALLLSAGSAAMSQPVICDAHDDVVDRLGHEFGETQQALGVVDEKSVLELFVSNAGTWTIVVTDTNGRTCIIAAGEGWDGAAQQAGWPS